MFAIATFGSHCRNDSDHISDKDLLLVCARRGRFKILQSYERKGYSVSAYAPNQLSSMRKSGSLFLQHIKEEAVLTHDVDGMFRKFLDSCPLVTPSPKEILRCKESIGFVFSWPDLEVLQAWKIDLLYCLIRDLFIKLLAANELVVFGINDIALQAAEMWGIPSAAFFGFRRAREVKNLYRSGDATPPRDFGTIVHSLSELITFVDADWYRNEPEDILSLCEHASKSKTSRYLLLRTLEAANTLGEVHGLEHSDQARVLRLVRRPNAYGSSSQFRRNEISKLLEEVVANLLANNVLKGKSYFAARTRSA